jgi:hypothetical protein
MKVSVKGVLVGGITDVVLSSILGIPFVIYVMASHDLLKLPKEQVSATLTATIHGNIGLYAIQLLIGFACSVIGGNVAARLAKHDELLNGVLASWLCVGIGVLSLVNGGDSMSLGTHLMLIASTVLAYVLGAYIQLSMVRAKMARA